MPLPNFPQKVKSYISIRYEYGSEGPLLDSNLWFVAVLVGTGGTLLLIIIVCFVQHNKSGKYPGKFSNSLKILIENLKCKQNRN